MSEDKPNTEQAIKDAAKKVFMLYGLKGARMQTIADEAGINRAMLHYYFRNKEKLFEVIFIDAMSEMNDRMGAIAEADLTIFEKIEHFMNGFSDKALENPEFELFMMNEFRLNPKYFEKLMQSSTTGKSVRSFLTELEKAQKRKEIIGDPNQIFLFILSTIIMPFAGMTMLRTMMGKTEQEYMQLMQERKSIFLEFLVKAIKP
ncbi:MAG TPA: TetR/AcrR family transcriptional regulator [Saprospiraceae bacterium]|nr:TetR/AcrR family transcriptional regulator [Saprospiraceae bacterium]HMP22679.1 TetR/AcrR family transcriptional regulator [Saprospiraceae bacterium]